MAEMDVYCTSGRDNVLDSTGQMAINHTLQEYFNNVLVNYFMSNLKFYLMVIKKCTSLVKIFGYLMIMFAILFSSQVFGQQLPGQQAPRPPEYSDSELIVFIKAAQRVTPLHQESQMKMIKKIEDENLTVEIFNNILETQRTGAKIDATEEQIEAFNKSIEGIQEIQMEYDTIIINAIEGEGITPEKYEEIITNYQQNPEIQMRINVLAEKMEDE